METDWAENRAKLPQDIIRGTLGKLVDSVYSTGELDRFRTRLERTRQRHRDLRQPSRHDRGLQHRAEGPDRLAAAPERPRARDRIPAPPDGEAGRLAGAVEDWWPRPARRQQTARIANVGRPAGGADQRSFERAWRRVGLALDRTGFTVEDRDRSAGTYFVRYVPPNPDKKEPGLLRQAVQLEQDRSAAQVPHHGQGRGRREHGRRC